jgi:hypothetical protein
MNKLLFHNSKFPSLFAEVFYDDIEDKSYLSYTSSLCVHHCISGFGVGAGVLPLSTSLIELVTLKAES